MRGLAKKLACHRVRGAEPAVDRYRLSIDIAGLVAGQEQRDIGEFLGLRGAAERVELAQLVGDVLGLGIIECRLGHPRLGQAGADGVDANAAGRKLLRRGRSEEHTSELQSLMRISYAVLCLQKKNNNTQ